MSRKGDMQPVLPTGVRFVNENGTVTLSNDKGSLDIRLLEGIQVETTKAASGEEILVCHYNKEDKLQNMHAGTIMALINNAIIGLTEGFSVTLTLKGTGCKVVDISGNKIKANTGKSNFDHYLLPEGVKASAPDPTTLVLEGIDKQKVGAFGAEVRSSRDAKRDPYKHSGWTIKGKEGPTKEVRKG